MSSASRAATLGGVPGVGHAELDRVHDSLMEARGAFEYDLEHEGAVFAVRQQEVVEFEGLIVDHVKQIESRWRFPVFVTRWAHSEGRVEFVAVGDPYQGEPA